MDPKNQFVLRDRRFSRRDFLRWVGMTAAGVVISSCLPKNAPPPTITVAAPATAQSATAAPTVPAAATSGPAASTAAAPAATKAQVAIGRAASYDRKLIRQQIETMFDSLGGLKDVVKSGGKVVIKTNLTGGSNFTAPGGFSEIETYMTHPEVVRAVGELVRDAGAGKLYIVEAAYDAQSFQAYGYSDIAKDLNATLIDLNKVDPYPDFATVPVAGKWYFYEKFFLNHILEEADTFISVAKMKCHFNAGITLSMKNLVGIAPAFRYLANAGDWWRSGFHSGDTQSRLPRIVLDLNRARPIHLAVIDGVMTAEGGEAPRGSFKPVQPGVLVAGKNPVATDAVSAAVMSFDPTVEPPNAPFLRGDNYLNLANSLGLGTNRLEEIAVLGAKIDEVKYKFNPAVSMG
jgi:uncharacterized protein (DUF362 family)